MLRPSYTIALVLCGLLIGCTEGERSLGARLLPGWSDMDRRAAGPGVRPESQRPDPNAPWPNLASVPPRPNVDWQTRFDTLSQGLTQDMNDAHLAGADSVPPAVSGPVARKGDDYVPAPPVLSPVPVADVSKPMAGVPVVSLSVPKPPDIPVGRKQPPAAVPQLPAMAPAPVVPAEVKMPDVAMPDVNRIAPDLKQEPAAQQVAVRTDGPAVTISWQAEKIAPADKAALEQIARLAINQKKRIRVQIYAPDDSAAAADLALARGAGVISSLTRLGVPRRDIVLANPVSASGARAAAAAPGGGMHQSVPNTADITLLP